MLAQKIFFCLNFTNEKWRLGILYSYTISYKTKSVFFNFFKYLWNVFFYIFRILGNQSRIILYIFLEWYLCCLWNVKWHPLSYLNSIWSSAKYKSDSVQGNRVKFFFFRQIYFSFQIIFLIWILTSYIWNMIL